jgi:hypothetical protein
MVFTEKNTYKANMNKLLYWIDEWQLWAILAIILIICASTGE